MSSDLIDWLWRLCEEYKLPQSLVIECQSLIDEFKRLDKQRERKITYDQCLNLQKFNNDTQLLQKIFTDNEGKVCDAITFQQYSKGLLFKNRNIHWKRVFDKVDEDKDGFVNKSELELYFMMIGYEYADARLNSSKIIKLFDVIDNDKQLNLDEFILYLNSCLDAYLEK